MRGRGHGRSDAAVPVAAVHSGATATSRRLPLLVYLSRQLGEKVRRKGSRELHEPRGGRRKERDVGIASVALAHELAAALGVGLAATFVTAHDYRLCLC